MKTTTLLSVGPILKIQLVDRFHLSEHLAAIYGVKNFLQRLKVTDMALLEVMSALEP